MYEPEQTVEMKLRRLVSYQHILSSMDAASFTRTTNTERNARTPSKLT